jgi:hypothetical protein
MRAAAKKLTATALVEGQTETWKIECDFFFQPNGSPVAILEWGTDMELLDAQYVPVNPKLLFESKSSDTAWSYRNFDHPILIPKALANSPKPSTKEAFRRGYRRVG